MEKQVNFDVSEILPEDSGGYIEIRLNGQMRYYHKLCRKLKREENICALMSIICTALIPIFILSIDDIAIIKHIVALLGAASTVCSSILLLHRTKEVKLNYRATYEALKREYTFYINSIDVYASNNHEEKAKMFIKRCETIMRDENDNWIDIRKEQL
jgi:uncharacterized membrane protein YgaE (UPF0421/DUF939 family)